MKNITFCQGYRDYANNIQPCDKVKVHDEWATNSILKPDQYSSHGCCPSCADRQFLHYKIHAVTSVAKRLKAI